MNLSRPASPATELNKSNSKRLSYVMAWLALATLGCLSELSVLAESAARTNSTPQTGSAFAAAVEESSTTGGSLVVRLYYGDRQKLAELAARYDLFEYVNQEQGYVLAQLWPSEHDELTKAGHRMEVDQALTKEANRPLENPPYQLLGIPEYPCYRTVEETFASLTQLAANYPNLVSLVDVGDSWEKQLPGGAPGYDLLVAVLANKSRPGPKPRFFLMAEHHARELTTAETAMRLVEELAAGYGVDPDTTWILDYFEVHILPLANPDGRKWAEEGRYWRKNTNNTNGCSTFPNYGTDLNRNCDFNWGPIGSSSNPCSEVYRGPAPASEPENQAIQAYVRSLFPDQRGPGDSDPAPSTATGLIISLHSFSELVLYPWGWTASDAPNKPALQALGGKFGFFNRYTVQPSNQLYPTSGSLDDWAYGELGVASYTFEMGTTFFEACDPFETIIYPRNRPALFYAAKACRQPYSAPAGPDVVQPAVSSTQPLAGELVTITATADASRSFGTTQPQPVYNIIAARYSLDDPSWIDGVVTRPMAAGDGSFDSPAEALSAMVDTAALSPGQHIVFIEAQDAGGNWGLPSAAFVRVQPFNVISAFKPEGLVLSWPSMTNRLYSVLVSDELSNPFSVLKSDILAQPPLNSYTVPLTQAAARFYRIFLQPE